MRILAFTKDWYGQRIVKTIKEKGPREGVITEVNFSIKLPDIVDEPEEFLPKNLPESDLILFLTQDSGTVQLLPAIAERTKARAVIVAVDNPDWLRPGLQLQIEKELCRRDVPYVFARPLCTLTEIGDPVIDEFTKYFGTPTLEIRLKGDLIEEVDVKRGSPCGCTFFVAEGLRGTEKEKAIEKSGLLFHNYPCMASMKWDNIVNETLMHAAGFKIRNAVRDALEKSRI